MQHRLPACVLVFSVLALTTCGGGGGGGGGSGLGSYGSQFVSNTVPGDLTKDTGKAVSVTIKNTGETAWATSAVHLEATSTNQVLWTGFGSGGSSNGATDQQVDLPAAVQPGSEVTLTFSVDAGATVGTRKFAARMRYNGDWFGPTLSVEVSVTAGSGGGQAGATFGAHTIPASVTQNTVNPITVKVKNTGTTTWSAASTHLAAAATNQFIWSGFANGGTSSGLTSQSVHLAGDVAPGGDVTLSFSMDAGAAVGTRVFTARMQDGTTWFGPTLSVSVEVQAGGGGQFGSAFVSNTIPTTMPKDTSRSVSVTIKNSGDTTWSTSTTHLEATASNQLIWSNFGSGGSSSGVANQKVKLPVSVAAGNEVTLNFSVDAGSATGTKEFSARMRDGSSWFGPTLSVNIEVESGGGGATQYRGINTFVIEKSLGSETSFFPVEGPDGSLWRSTYNYSSQYNPVALNRITPKGALAEYWDLSSLPCGYVFPYFQGSDQILYGYGVAAGQSATWGRFASTGPVSTWYKVPSVGGNTYAWTYTKSHDDILVQSDRGSGAHQIAVCSFQGQVKWQHVFTPFAGATNSFFQCVFQNDAFFLVGRNSTGSVPDGGFLAKVDKAGAILYQRRFHPTFASGYGYVGYPAAGDSTVRYVEWESGKGGDVVLAEVVFASGAVSFQRRIGQQNTSITNSLGEHPAGGFILRGEEDSGLGAWCARLDGSGDFIWQRMFDVGHKTNYPEGFDLRGYFANGDLLVSAETNLAPGWTPGSNSSNGQKILMRLDAKNGLPVWQRIFGVNSWSDTRFNSMYICGNDNVLIRGHTYEYLTKNRYHFNVLLSGLGATIEKKGWAGAEEYSMSGIRSMKNGELLGTGSSGSYPNRILFLQRFSSEGRHLWSRTFGIAGTDDTDSGYNLLEGALGQCVFMTSTTAVGSTKKPLILTVGEDGHTDQACIEKTMTPGNTPLVMGAVSLTSQVTYSASRSANIVVPVSVASPGNLQVTPFTPSIPRVSVSQVKRCR